MTIIQEETTPIGDFYHSCGIHTLVNEIEAIVDDFELDTDELTPLVDCLVLKAKSFKSHIQKAEANALKMQNMRKLNDRLNRGFD